MKVRWLNCVLIFSLFGWNSFAQTNATFQAEARAVLQKVIMANAAWALEQEPVTISAYTCERSAGGKNDFYSEGDYWWPDTTNISGPYVQRDGMTNPENFTAHRKAMIRFSKIIGALASAYRITGNEIYVKHAMAHLDAWFSNESTKMNPHLLYAQAVKGRVTGRSIGIIDTIHLMEVAQGVRVMEKAAAANSQVIQATKNWFAKYLAWLTSHPYGKEEMQAKNNHGTCWVMQVAAFAKLTNDKALLEFCRERYKDVLLPDQMAADGSFPLELKRTKPYGYSIFNLDAMATICQIISDESDNLWTYETPDKKSISKGISFLFPYLRNKDQWPYPSDVMYWDNWPVAQPALMFGAEALNERSWFDVWASLDHDPKQDEVIRNLPIRNPIIWFDNYIRVNKN